MDVSCVAMMRSVDFGKQLCKYIVNVYLSIPTPAPALSGTLPALRFIDTYVNFNMQNIHLPKNFHIYTLPYVCTTCLILPI